MHGLPQKENHFLPHKSMILQRQNKLFFKLLFSKLAQNFIFNGNSSKVVCMIFIALCLLLYRYTNINGSILSEMAYTDIKIGMKNSQHLPLRKKRRHKFQCNYFLTVLSSYRLSLQAFPFKLTAQTTSSNFQCFNQNTSAWLALQHTGSSGNYIHISVKVLLGIRWREDQTKQWIYFFTEWLGLEGTAVGGM